MWTKRYYQVTFMQLIISALLIGVISASLATINIVAKDYFLLPTVMTTGTGECVTVLNIRNGDAYECSNVGVVLRNYRTKVVDTKTE